MKYECYFNSYGAGILTTTIPDIATAKEGFWVDRFWEYTTGSDNTWWIPPSAVVCVRKDRGQE
jgi:hypothetical protein